MKRSEAFKTNIEVEISNIEVDDDYYNFNYKVTVNGKVTAEEEYQSDHAWGDDKESFMDMLVDGEAVTLALENGLN